MDAIIDITFLGWPLSTWFLAAGVAGGGILVGLLVRWIGSAVLRRGDREERAEERAGSRFAPRMVQSFVFPAIVIGSFYSASTIFDLNGRVDAIVSAVFVILFSLLSIRFLVSIVNEFFERASVTQSHDHFSRWRPLRSIAVSVVWVVGVLFLLSNLGFNISTVVAGLGIGGIAVALAAQALLGDLFSYFVIVFDRPFELGDFLIFGDILGTVEKIGIKTTRLRSLGGEQIIISNSDLTNSRVRNYKRMERRRVVFKIGVVYGTAADLVREIPVIIREIIEGEPLAVFDRAHFAGYGDWSLNFEVVYYVGSPDYNVYMDIQQRINQGIYDAFAERGISFAFPTQTVYLPGGPR
jgi:small-conductance mechanosensitive channel